MTLPRLLLATGNKAKIGEYQALLGHLPFQVRIPREEGLDIEVEETGSTMQENVSLKALAYAKASGLVSLADDSGLEVDALGGEPGVMSARYAGEGASDRERIDFLLAKLEGVPWEGRKARFRCVIGVATPEGWIELREGTCRGIITFEPRGEQGFGYDPVFYLPRLARCMAELTLEEKNRVSHRARAAHKAEAILRRLHREGILE
jgi:XTP/dITP diphosphohydrolase